MELLMLLGLIGMELVVVTTEYLPPPELTLLTSETIYMGQKVELQCTAPKNYPEGTFFLISNNTGLQLQMVDAPETRNSVTFTIETPYTLKSMKYVCRYQCYIGEENQMSEASDVLSLTFNIPVWILVVVGLLVLLILVALVTVCIFLMKRNKRKKQEQRDKDSIWINQHSTPDWSKGEDNMVFSLNHTSKSCDMSPTYMGHTDTQTDGESAAPFSTFRT
ncbi:protein HIDE1 [Dendropsophus ebraccatus]|uniref:protein HIDE1 n=1 Tax=Dendropsophus ebraccatus TaxID=150705 RepID=UPI003831B9D8